MLKQEGETPRMVAVKFVNEQATALDKDAFIREIELMKKVNHPNVVRLLGVCLEKEPFCLILELVEGGALLQWLQRMAVTKQPVEATRQHLIVRHRANERYQCFFGGYVS